MEITYYEEYIKQNSDKAINYQCWIYDKHIEFKKLNRLPPYYPMTENYIQDFTEWLKGKSK